MAFECLKNSLRLVKMRPIHLGHLGWKHVGAIKISSWNVLINVSKNYWQFNSL